MRFAHVSGLLAEDGGARAERARARLPVAAAGRRGRFRPEPGALRPCT